ncbi:hypothetical protein ACQ4PT_010192 [Festuca glaucescens]
MEIETSLPRELDTQYDAIAAGEKLYAFHTFGGDEGVFHCLGRTEADGIRPIFGDDSEEEEVYLPQGLRMQPQPRWAWERIPAPPPLGGYFGVREDKHSRALHPDGRTVFISAGSNFVRQHEKDLEGTFSLDTASGEWTRRGDWHLPFKGQAHYDGDVGAWVGTRTVYNEEDGCCYEHLCTCEVPALQQGGASTPEPAWMVAKERLTFLEPTMNITHGRALVPAGGSLFCLVEPAVRQGFTYRNFMGAGDKCQL